MNSTSRRGGRGRLGFISPIVTCCSLLLCARAYGYDAEIINYGSAGHSLYVYYDTNYLNIGDTINVHVVESESGGDVYEYAGEFGSGDFTLDPNGPWGYSVGGGTSMDRWMTIVPNAGGDFDVGIMFSLYPSYEQIHAHITFSVPSPNSVITSATSVNRNQGDVPSYQITATNSPTSFNASSLPSGTTVNTSTGVISGRLNASGTVNSTISASNSSGGQTVGLTWNITAASITNTSSVTPAVIAPGQSVSITRSGTTNFTFGWTECVVWPPTGSAQVLSNAAYGTYSYTPAAGDGTYSVQTRIADAYGNYTDKWLTFRVNSAPVVQSVSATSVAAGAATQITARATDIDANLATLYYYITGPGGYSNTLVASVTATNASDCTLVTSWTPTAIGTYTVQIGASDSDGFYYAGSSVTATFTAGPTVPGNVTGTTVGSTFIALSWSASTGGTIAGYEVYRNGTKISGTSLITGTTFTDNSVNPATPYAYTVKAYDSNGNGSALSSAFNTTSAGSMEVFTPLP